MSRQLDILALEPFFGGYYRDPRPAVAVEAFRAWSDGPGSNSTGGAEMFVRAIRRFPDVRAAFEAIRVESALVPKLLAAAYMLGFIACLVLQWRGAPKSDPVLLAATGGVPGLPEPSLTKFSMHSFVSFVRFVVTVRFWGSRAVF